MLRYGWVHTWSHLGEVSYLCGAILCLWKGLPWWTDTQHSLQEKTTGVETKQNMSWAKYSISNTLIEMLQYLFCKGHHFEEAMLPSTPALVQLWYMVKLTGLWVTKTTQLKWLWLSKLGNKKPKASILFSQNTCSWEVSSSALAVTL